MNTTNNYKFKSVLTVVFASCISLLMLLSSCKKDNEASGNFAIKDNPTKLEAAASGATETYTVQASGNWKVEPLRKENWVKIEPLEGNGNGTFTVTVNKNTDPETRNLTLFFTSEGKLQNSVIKIEQAAASEQETTKDPNLSIDGITGNRIEAEETGVTTKYILRSTGKWRIAFEEEASWVTVAPMEGEGDTPITITVNKNTDIERLATLLLFLNDVQQATPLTVYQKGVKLQVEGDVVLREDFSWLNYGSEILSVTTGETQMNSWTTDQKAKGWTSTTNTTADVGATPFSTYARPGFVKLGRTSYGSDIISPKLDNVQKTKNLLVTFKAVRYAAGDHYLLTVGVKGAGTVSKSSFDIMNVPTLNSDLAACRAAWLAPEATYSFVITGATKETQVWFLGGAFDQRTGNWPKTTNRIFIDDIVITVTK